jgi:hypothetical protein
VIDPTIRDEVRDGTYGRLLLMLGAAVLGSGPDYSYEVGDYLLESSSAQLFVIKFATALGDEGEHPRGQGIFMDMLLLEAFCLWGPG